MNFDIQPVQRDQFGDWLRLREAVYTGIDDEFHDQEMELFLGDDTKECFLAITDAGDTCGMVEVSLRNIVDGCFATRLGSVAIPAVALRVSIRSRLFSTTHSQS